MPDTTTAWKGCTKNELITPGVQQQKAPAGNRRGLRVSRYPLLDLSSLNQDSIADTGPSFLLAMKYVSDV